jgi:hypothetical protein
MQILDRDRPYDPALEIMILAKRFAMFLLVWLVLSGADAGGLEIQPVVELHQQHVGGRGAEEAIDIGRGTDYERVGGGIEHRR